MSPTLSEQLTACAHELELAADEFVSIGLPNRAAMSAAALLSDAAARVAKRNRRSQPLCVSSIRRKRSKRRNQPSRIPANCSR